MEEEGAVQEKPRLFGMFDLEEKPSLFQKLEPNYEDQLISMWLGGRVEHSPEEETINFVGVYDGYFDPWPTSFYNLAVNDPGFCLRRGGVPQPPHHMMLTGTPVVKDAGQVKFSITASEGGVDISSHAMHTLKHASRCVQERYVQRSLEDMCWLGPVARWPTKPIVSDTDELHDSGEVEVSCVSAFHMMRYIISGTSAISPLPKIVVDLRHSIHSMMIATSFNSWICKTIAMGCYRSVKRYPEEETNCFSWYEVKPNRIGWYHGLFTRSYQWGRKSLFAKGAAKDSGEVKFSMIPASKGGVDIKIGSHTMHVPKHCSARHALVSMMLFARNLLDDTFSCAKFMVPTRILNLLGGSISSASPKVYEAGWVPAKSRPESRNAGVAGETPVGSIGRNSTSCVPVLFDVSKLADSEPGSTAIPSATPPALAAEEDEDTAYYDATSDADTRAGLESMATAAYLDQENKNKDFPMHNNSDSYIFIEGIREVTRSRPEHSLMEAAEEKTAATWLVATAAAHHATGNRGLLSCFTPGQPGRFLRSADGAAPMQVLGHGSVITDTVVLPNVLYVPGLTANLISPSQLAELDYTVRFSRGACHIRSVADGAIVGKATVGEDGSFELDFLKVLPVI